MNNLFLTQEFDYKHVLRNRAGTIIGEFLKDNDGFFYYFPISENGGSYSESFLNYLLQTLIELNKPWNEEIKEYFDEINVEVTKNA